MEVATAIGLPLQRLTAFELKLLCEAPQRTGRLTAADVRSALRFQGFATRPTIPQAVQRYVLSLRPPGERGGSSAQLIR